MLATELFESPSICPVCGCTPCNCTHVIKENEQLDEASYRDVLRELLDRFYKDVGLPPIQGNHLGILDIKSPGTRVWTRGDGVRHRDPGYIRPSYWSDEPKKGAVVVQKFWQWLQKQPGVRPLGQISGEFGNSKFSDMVGYKGLYFAGGQRGVEFGSASRFKNPRSVWRHKAPEQSVAEGTGNIEVGDKITWWYNKYHPNYEGIVREVIGNTIIVYAPGSGDRFKLTKDDIRSHKKQSVRDDDFDEGVAEGLGKDLAKMAAVPVIAGAAAVGGQWLDDQKPHVDIGGEQVMVVDNPGWGTIPNNAMTLTGKDGREYKVWKPSGKGTSQWLATPVEAVKEGTDIVPAANPEDTVSLDIPLLIRLLEYSREDAKTDMDLHNVAERLITLSAGGKTLSMNDYDTIIPGSSD